MIKRHYSEIPTGYAVCQCTDCPRAGSCLHQIAYNELLQKDTYLHLINPKRCTKDDKCESYRSNEPIKYARGFKNFQTKMYPQQYESFKAECILKFGRNPYFERRRGDVLLPPSEQDFILKVLIDSGVTEIFSFDSYEEDINLFD